MRWSPERQSAAGALSAVIAFGLGACGLSAAPEQQAAASCGAEANLTYENFGQPFFLSWCSGCHGADLDENERAGAPAQLNFDDLTLIRGHRTRIMDRAVRHATMPPAGGPPEEERRRLGEWLACGAPGKPQSFQPAPSVPVWSAPTGSCANPREPLPDAILPRCSRVTYDCILACTGRADGDLCRNACLAADATPPAVIQGYPVSCATCTLLQLFACGEQSGCHDPLADALCCSERACPPGSDEGCAEQRCAGENRALGLCLGYAAESCLGYTSGEMARCFER
jgi:mono/diheme cytochrome c family protein